MAVDICSSNGALRLLADPPSSALLHRYTVVQVVAATSMSTVYLGCDRRDDRAVAIKRLSLGHGASADAQRAALRAFRQEARLLRGLRHPQIPRLRDVFLDATGHYLVMDYIAGLTLDRYLARGAAPLATGLAIADGLCDVAAYLHRQSPPLVHADIKPANIMLARDGLVVLIDFGLARESDRPTALHAPMGTPPYAPPEQWSDRPLDLRSDVYAIGMVLRDLLRGVEHPPAVDRALARATASAPADRFETVARLRRALHGAG